MKIVWIFLMTCAICLILTIALSGLASAPARAKDRGLSAVGWIEIGPGKKGAGHMAITGRVFGVDRAKGRYSLDIKRGGAGGSSKSGQKGEFEVSAGENAALSTTNINIDPSDVVEITLILQLDDGSVFETTLKPRL
jgi:hypothetical protein